MMIKITRNLIYNNKPIVLNLGTTKHYSKHTD